MSLLSHQIELLSPARDADIGIEAINHGADAVYIGGPGFGARASAGNSVQDIERLAKHAHQFNSKIFITLNTILRDDELEGARQMAWDVYNAGADVLIVQDMALLEMDLPPIQLHASTQTDIRTVEKAKFLSDVGFSQIVLARELSLRQIAEIYGAIDSERTKIEFFIHGALCVAYSGQCFISHAHTGRSANRGDCSQACRLPYEVKDSLGRIVAHDKHVLSMKDNNQSGNLESLINAGVRSFKIEGRYKDMAYVKNITAHYRKLLDEIIEKRESGKSANEFPITRSSSGSTTFTFTPDPDQNFNREFTDYFVNGRKEDIGAFDTPKNPGQAIGCVTAVGEKHIDLELTSAQTILHNGDGLCYHTLHKELVGVQINRAQALSKIGAWRVFPKDPIAGFKDLRKGVQINRNRDMDWVRTLDKKSSDRRIGLWATLVSTSSKSVKLTLTDEDGFSGHFEHVAGMEYAQDAIKNEASLIAQLSRFGSSNFELLHIDVSQAAHVFLPASNLNAMRREALAQLESDRRKAYERPTRLAATEPPAIYPEDTLTYLANVFNQKAHDFYAKHGVKVIGAAYESQEEEGEVSLMITKHCVRFSLSLCPKQAKGVTGVQGTVKAEPMQLINGKEKLTLRFDCKPCEMHVVGKLKTGVKNQLIKDMALPSEAPIKFYRTRPLLNSTSV
jgi:23S rRNA 5-hydroxycytidine C2501 synthase